MSCCRNDGLELLPTFLALVGEEGAWRGRVVSLCTGLCGKRSSTPKPRLWSCNQCSARCVEIASLRDVCSTARVVPLISVPPPPSDCARKTWSGWVKGEVGLGYVFVSALSLRSTPSGLCLGFPSLLFLAMPLGPEARTGHSPSGR